MTDLSPSTLGRQMADRDVHEAVLGLLLEVTATERAQAAVQAQPSPDDAAYLAAKRKRLEQIAAGLGRVSQ